MGLWNNITSLFSKSASVMPLATTTSNSVLTAPGLERVWGKVNNKISNHNHPGSAITSQVANANFAHFTSNINVTGMMTGTNEKTYLIGTSAVTGSYQARSNSAVYYVPATKTLHAPNFSGFEDTGWISLTLASGVSSTTASGGRSPAYRRIGKHVYIEGAVTFTATTAAKTIATLPAGYRPSRIKHKIVAVTGSAVARIWISAGGVLSVEWIRNLSNGSQVTGTISWVSIEMDFWTD